MRARRWLTAAALGIGLATFVPVGAVAAEEGPTARPSAPLAVTRIVRCRITENGATICTILTLPELGPTG